MSKNLPQIPPSKDLIPEERNKIIRYLLKIPVIKYLIAYNGGYYLSQISNYKQKFEEGVLVRYIGNDYKILSGEPDEDLGYFGYEIENNIGSKTPPLGIDSSWTGFNYLKENKLLGKILKCSLNVPYGVKPKYIVEFTVPFLTRQGVNSVTTIKVVLHEDQLDKV